MPERRLSYKPVRLDEDADHDSAPSSDEDGESLPWLGQLMRRASVAPQPLAEDPSHLRMSGIRRGSAPHVVVGAGRRKSVREKQRRTITEANLLPYSPIKAQREDFSSGIDNPLDEKGEGVEATMGYHYLRWNAPRGRAEVLVILGGGFVIATCCLLSIVLYCFAFRDLDAIHSPNWNPTNATDPTTSLLWRPSDAVYFTVSTFLGSGFGDVVPTSTVGRIYAVLLHAISIVVAGAGVGALLSDMVRAQENRRWNLKVLSRRVFASKIWAGCGLEAALTSANDAEVAQWQQDANYLSLHLSGASLLFVALLVGGGIAYWAAIATQSVGVSFLDSASQALHSATGNILPTSEALDLGVASRGADDSPGLAVYLFAGSAVGLTYGDVPFPSDWINRLAASAILMINSLSYFCFLYFVANVLMTRFYWPEKAGSVKMLLHGSAEYNYSTDSYALAATFDGHAPYSRGALSAEQVALEAFETLLAATHSAQQDNSPATPPIARSFSEARRVNRNTSMKTPLGSALGATEEEHKEGPAERHGGDESSAAQDRAETPSTGGAASSSTRRDLAFLKHTLVSTGVVDPAFFLACADWFDYLADPAEDSGGNDNDVSSSDPSSRERRVSAATLRRLEYHLHQSTRKNNNGVARLNAARVKLGQARAQVSSAAAPALDRMRARVSALSERVGDRRSHTSADEGMNVPDNAVGSGLRTPSDLSVTPASPNESTTRVTFNSDS